MNPLIVVPTYNEAENIAELVPRILKTVPDAAVLVVDDNSPDGTSQIVEKMRAQEPRVHLLLRQKKEGLAQAYLAGFRWGIERGYDSLVEMDADFSHDPKDIPRLLKELRHADAVSGTRYVSGGKISGWSWVRQLVSRGGNVYAKCILQMPQSDLTGGFNAWRRATLEKIDYSTVRSKGYAFQIELKYRAYRKGLKIVEVPIHFANRTRGKSKMTGNIVWEAASRVFQMKFKTVG